MGATCSHSCAQTLELKTSDFFDKFRNINSTKPHFNFSFDSEDSIILDPVEVLPKALIRRYLVKKYLRAIPIFSSFLQPGKVTLEAPQTHSTIAAIEQNLPEMNGKRIKGQTIENFPTVFLYEGGCYSGQWDISQQKPEGFGVFIYQDYSKYIGEVKSGKKSGKGRLVGINGDVYEGEFYNDRMQGIGMLRKSNGTVYKGGFLNNYEHGEGTIDHMKKNIYTGGFFKGLKHGHGKLVIDGCVYVGDFLNDQMDGNGTYQWKDGKHYSGGWKNNKMHGYGTYKWKDGNSYVGYFVDGIREGIGNFKWNDGREYKGGWSKGKMHGEGAYIYIDKGKKRNFVAVYEYGKRKKILRY